MNTELRKKAKNEFEKNFFKLMNNSVFGKTMENVRNHRDIKLVTSDKRRKPLLTDTDSFIIYIKTQDFFDDISNDVEKWFDTSNYNKKDKIPLPIGKNKKVPGLFKDELGGKIMTEFVALRPKAYAYLDDDGNEHKKSGTKGCVIKQNLDCLFNNKNVYRSQQRLKAIIVMFTQKKLIKLC